MKTQNSDGRIIAIITMLFLFAMISFVTNLAAPIGVIWKNTYQGNNENTVGMLGNAMNFLAYLFMGIPAGKMLRTFGYKRTALIGIALGFVGVLIQYLSGHFGVDNQNVGFVTYLVGAFVAGFSVCILNTVVNPMLNLLGGGGNRGNQLNLLGATSNSLAGMFTPLFVGALISEVTKRTAMMQVYPVLYIAMLVFLLAFVIISFIPIKDPELGRTTKETVFEHSAWSFRHFVLGAVSIFVYVGVEIGIPGTLFYYISDKTINGAGVSGNAVAIAGSVAATYWCMMLIGRFSAGFIAGRIPSKSMLLFATATGMVLIAAAMLLGNGMSVMMPVFKGNEFDMVTVPIAALLLVLCGLFTSIMWSCIFNLATEGLGKYTASASGIFMMMVVGGGILPLLQNFMADRQGYLLSYTIPLLGMAFMFYYALKGHQNVNRDIPTV